MEKRLMNQPGRISLPTCLQLISGFITRIIDKQPYNI